MDYRKMYEENEDFKRYVNLYSAKHGITVPEALEHWIVRSVAADYARK